MTKVFGSIVRQGANWHIHAEPHVMIRLKRIFPRAKESGTLVLKDTDEVCRDIEWAIDRFPLAIDPNDRAHLLSRAREYEKRYDEFNRVVLGSTEPREFSLALPPRHYQRVAADLVLRMGGLLVVDDLGLGKTVVGIATLTDPRTRPALVVTQTHLVPQWEREFAKFAPNLTTHVLKKGTPYQIKLKNRKKKQLDLYEPEFPDVIITSYSKLGGWYATLEGVTRSVVFDEVQELRRCDSVKYTAAKTIAHAAAFKLGLTATPIYNYGSEFFNVFDVLRPGALGTQEEFLREWCKGVWGGADKARISEPKAFGTYVREQGLMIRRTRKDVGRELPDLIKIPHYVNSDPKALNEVSKSVADLAKFILAREGDRFSRMKAAGDLDWRLRQATGIAKAPYVAEFVKMLLETEKKVVLFGWHHAVYDIWRDKLKEFKPVFYTGEESVAQKEAAKAAFVSGDSRVLVMSLRSGSGVDGLQDVCKTCVFGELDWSPKVHDQGSGRLHRDGQDEPVAAYYLVSDEGSDPVVSSVLGVKKGQIEGVTDPDAALIESQDDVGDRMKRLAEDVLLRRGEKIPANVLDERSTEDKMAADST